MIVLLFITVDKMGTDVVTKQKQDSEVPQPCSFIHFMRSGS